MTGPKRASSPMERVWDFLTSVKLAIFTLITLAAASVVGTIVPQNEPPEKYRAIYEDWAFGLMDRVGLFDMYHSGWYLALLVLFAVNLSCCTIERFPRVWRAVRNPRAKMDEGLEKSLSPVERWTRKGIPAEWVPRYAAALSSSFAKPQVAEEGGAFHLYAERGAASRFGVYVTHASILVIFLGAILGNVWGFKGYVGIPEGESVSEVPLRGKGQVRDLGFEVRCNRFSVDTYPTGEAKAYVSDLSVIEGGLEVVRKRDVVVNDPLRYKGVWFYQSSYGEAGGAVARIGVRRPDGSGGETLSLPPDHPVFLPEYGAVRAVDFDPDYRGNGPALRLVVEKAGAPPEDFWLPHGSPAADRQGNDARVFSFEGLEARYYTGLEVVRDPGVNVVWAGCALLILGILMAFYLSHERVWLRLAPGPDGRTSAVLAGSAGRNRLAFERTFEKILAGVKAVGT